MCNLVFDTTCLGRLRCKLYLLEPNGTRHVVNSNRLAQHYPVVAVDDRRKGSIDARHGLEHGEQFLTRCAEPVVDSPGDPFAKGKNGDDDFLQVLEFLDGDLNRGASGEEHVRGEDPLDSLETGGADEKDEEQ